MRRPSTCKHICVFAFFAFYSICVCIFVRLCLCICAFLYDCIFCIFVLLTQLSPLTPNQWAPDCKMRRLLTPKQRAMMDFAVTIIPSPSRCLCHNYSIPIPLSSPQSQFFSSYQIITFVKGFEQSEKARLPLYLIITGTVIAPLVSNLKTTFHSCIITDAGEEEKVNWFLL